MTAILLRQARKRGVFGTSKAWTGVWVLLVAVRVVRRLTRNQEKVVLRERLEPGETLVIRAVAPPS
jgi:hypothetical protein